MQFAQAGYNFVLNKPLKTLKAVQMKTSVIFLVALYPYLGYTSPSEVSVQLETDYEELASFSSKIKHYGIDAVTFEKRFWQGLAQAIKYFSKDVLQNPNTKRELPNPFHLRFPRIHEVQRKSLSITRLSDGIAALERFTGPWYGLWEEMKVKHLWLPVRQSMHPLEGDFQLLAFQSAFTGDGIGWNFLVRHQGEVHMLGHVYHYDSLGHLTNQTPHYAYLDQAGQITWITEGHIFFETVCHEDHGHAGKHYVITGESYDPSSNEARVTNRFQAIYLAKDQLLPKFQYFPQRAGQAKLVFKILSALRGLLAATVR